MTIAERKLREWFASVVRSISTPSTLVVVTLCRFIPQGALAIIARDPAVADHFSGAISAA